MLTDFQNCFTLRLSSDCVMNWLLKIPSYVKCIKHYLVKCKCQETTDNLKQTSRLTIVFNLVYTVNNVFLLIYITMNIKTVLL